MGSERRLAIYLNDHLAGATAGVNLARRIARENAGNDYGRALEAISAEIDEDKAALIQTMEALGVSKAALKIGTARVAELIGRLKPNDRLIGYSPLSRLVELEALALGIMGKLELWRTLADLAGEDERLDRRRLKELTRRAESQRDEVRRLRQRASREALAA